MQIIQEVNILKSKKLAVILNVVAFLLMLVFGCLFTALVSLLSHVVELSDHYVFSDSDVWLFLGSFILLMVVHELIHGLFFKFYKPENKVKFGVKWSQGMAYATSPGSRYTRGQMLVIALAPFVFISLGLTLLLVLGWLNFGFYVILAAMHAGGCVGDFYYAYLLLIKHGKKDILVEDTETGMIIYQA